MPRTAHQNGLSCFKFCCSGQRFGLLVKLRLVKKRELVLSLGIHFCYWDVADVPFRSNVCNEQFDVHPGGKGENLLSASEHKRMLCLLPASGQSVISFQCAYFYPVLLS